MGRSNQRIGHNSRSSRDESASGSAGRRDVRNHRSLTNTGRVSKRNKEKQRERREGRHSSSQNGKMQADPQTSNSFERHERNDIRPILAKLDTKNPYELSSILGARFDLLKHYLLNSTKNVNRLTRSLVNIDIAFKSEITPGLLLNIIEAMEETEFISKSVTMLKLFFQTTKLMEDYLNNLDVVCTLIRIVTRVCTLSQSAKIFIFACKIDISEMIDVIRISVQDKQRPGDLENAAPTEGTSEISENLNKNESEGSSQVDECMNATCDVLSDKGNGLASLSISSGDSECKRKDTLIETTRFQTYLKDIDQLFEELEHAVQGSTIRNKKRVQELNNSDNGSGENFREIPIFPRIGDLNGDIKPRLRINKAKGGYETIDNYLDVQFRLLREDFVQPLRKGIRKFKYRKIQNSNVKLKDIKVYEKTQIISPFCGNGVNYILSFDVSNLVHVRWNMSKRLKFGSLVCLTTDNFETCFFAVIVDSNTRYRRKGRVHVNFFKSPQEDQFLQGATFTMIESTAYFEAYRPVLSSLQTIMDTKFPFQKYIIKCENETSPPKYLLQKSSEITMDLQCLLRSRIKFGNDGFYNYKESTNNVKILEKEWPIENQIPLDESQLNALKSALTRDFTLIQGPPGCGKTHIGLLIAKTLLFNRRKWQKENGVSSQMLIVCYTNHALDQFMEGICSFYMGNIVRIGGRSRNEALDKFNLKCIKQKYRESKIIPMPIQRGRSNALGDVMPLKRKLNLKSEKIKLLKENIVHENSLYTYMEKSHRKQFERFSKYYRPSPLPWLAYLGKSCIVEWLGIITTSTEVQKNIYLDHKKARDIWLNKRIDDLFCEETRETMVDTNFDETNIFDDSEKIELENFKRHELSLDFDQVRIIYLASCNDKKRKMIVLERKQIIKRLQNKLQTVKPMSKSEVMSVEDIMCKEFSEEKRWALYLYWVHNKCNEIKTNMDKDLEYYQQADKRLKEVEQTEELFILKNFDVIGMTTTGAANHKTVLREIKPAIMIVEEAAEVLESHLVSNLTEGCEQLVMIGDHKQLRPKPNVNMLKENYNLDLSLFERMVRNGIECNCLRIQHRMRPEIADNVRTFYGNLEDHKSVTNYETIKGVSHNVFFIYHCEEEYNDCEVKSYENEHEARYMIALCNYLLLQGYDASNITILTTYSGQWFLMKKKMLQHGDLLKDVQLKVVDNYQGEENDIILLSLVRSNMEGEIGYVAEENRICVALSRAKKGLFIIGNRDCLQSSSNKWKTILENMSKKGYVGEALHLRCENHPNDDGINAKSPEDFQYAPAGGCGKVCDIRLECGHSCEKLCHIKNKEHLNLICYKSCPKYCKNGHQCQKQCFQTCVCEEKIIVTLPKCRHVVLVNCSTDLEKYCCSETCNKMLKCGHVCKRKCIKCCVCMEPTKVTLKCGHDETLPCSVDPAKHKCSIQIKVKLPDCGHFKTILCRDRNKPISCKNSCGLPLKCGHLCKEICYGISNSNIDRKMHIENQIAFTSKCPRRHSTVCKNPCKAILTCGHSCKGTCGQCFQGRWHKLCDNECNCTLICGHTCRGKCGFCLPCTEKCKRSCKHAKCKGVCFEECIPCQYKCIWKCKHFDCTEMCGKACNRPRCNKPCDKLLKCMHRCIGMCGDPCPNICGTCDKEKILAETILQDNKINARYVQLQDCKHIIEYTIMDEYMDLDEGSSLKRCPICNAVIWTTLGNRYENIVNRIFLKLNDIRRLTLRDSKLQNILMASASKQLQEIVDGEEISYSTVRPFASSNFDLSTYFGKLNSWSDLWTFLVCRDHVNVLNYLSILSFIKSVSKLNSFSLDKEILFQYASLCLLSHQHICEVEREVKRFFDKCQLSQLKKIYSQANINMEVIKHIENAYSVLTQEGGYSEENRELVQEYIDQLPERDDVNKSLIGFSFTEVSIDRDAVCRNNCIDISHEKPFLKEINLQEKVPGICLKRKEKNVNACNEHISGVQNQSNDERSQINEKHPRCGLVINLSNTDLEDGEIMESKIQEIGTESFKRDSGLQQNEVTTLKEGSFNLEDIEDGEIIEEPELQVIFSNDRVDKADETKCTVMNITDNDVNETSQETKKRNKETTIFCEKNKCRGKNECENETESVVEAQLYQVKLLKWPGVPYFHHEQSVFDIEKLKKAQSQRSSKIGATCSNSNKRKRFNDKTYKMEPLGKKIRKDEKVSFKIKTKQKHYKNVKTLLEAFDANVFDKPSVITKTNNRDIGVTDKHVTKTFSNPWDNNYEVSVKGKTQASERNLVEYDDFELCDDTENTFSLALKQETKSQKGVNLKIGHSGKVIDYTILSKDLNCDTSGARVVCSQEPMIGQGIKHTRVSRKLSECDLILQDDNCTESEYTDTEIIPSRTQATIKEPNDPCDLRNVLNKKRRQQPGLKTDKTCDKGYIKTYNLRTRRKAKPLTSVSSKHMIGYPDKDKLKLSGISSRKRFRKVGSSKETDGDLMIEIKGDVYQVLDEV